MSIGVSLSPPSGDISVGLLSSLLGPKWWLLATGQAPSGAGSILAQLFSIADIALLMYVNSPRSLSSPCSSSVAFESAWMARAGPWMLSLWSGSGEP